MVGIPNDWTDPSADGPTDVFRARVRTWVERGRRVLDPRGDGPEAATGRAAAGHDDTPDGVGGGLADLPEEERAVLTDEERILHYLQQSGRVRQSEFVERTDWSKAKVSRVLSAMEDDDLICRTRVGREKIVSLPETQFGAAASPLEGHWQVADGGDRRDTAR